MPEITAEQAAALATLFASMAGDATPAAAPARTSVFAGAVRTSTAGIPADGRPAILHGLSMQDTRTAAAVHAVPLFACTVDAEWTLADGTSVAGAAHGFATPRKAGDPCPSTQGGGCKGVIRGE